jgi:predicted lipoprotein with Yx(FWY)xxD motif
MFTLRMPLSTLAVCVAFFWNVTAVAAPPPPIKLAYPGDVTLYKDSSGNYVYKSFPTLLRLFVYDKDRPGKSNCNDGCDTAWQPLPVSAKEMAISAKEARQKGRLGDWTIIRRRDGTLQWAYKNRAIYVRYHDLPPDASTDQEGFHLLKP